jgi:hypothetical protein
MKLLDIPPNYLNKGLASKICKNKSLMNRYIQKYDLVGGASNVENIKKKLDTSTLLNYNETILKELLNDPKESRKINFCADYIVRNPKKIFQLILTYFCTPIDTNHQCNYTKYLYLDIITSYTIEDLIELNKENIQNIKNCINTSELNKNLIIMIGLRTFVETPTHYLFIIIQTNVLYIIDTFDNSDMFKIKPHIENLLGQIGITTTKTVVKNNNMPASITKDMSCQIWTFMYIYIYMCLQVPIEDSNLENILNINPFQLLIQFISNIYYKLKNSQTDKFLLKENIDISSQIIDNDYDWYKINLHFNTLYVSLRRQFLFIEKITDTALKSEYMKKLINFGFYTLCNEIFAFKNFEQNILLKLYNYIEYNSEYSLYYNELIQKEIKHNTNLVTKFESAIRDFQPNELSTNSDRLSKGLDKIQTNLQILQELYSSKKTSKKK